MAFLFNKALLGDELVAMLILGAATSGIMLWTFFFVNKFIYARLDLELNKLAFGNFLFEQETDVNMVKVVGRFLWFQKIYRLRIGEKVYYVNVIADDDVDIISKFG